ncbi:MAG: hypothetical protein QXS54_11095 [Candidatus Methanomethylicaceae archaeon]
MPIMYKNLNVLVDLIRKRGKLSVFQCAKFLGMSPLYFRYQILPLLLEDFCDLTFDRKTKEVVALQIEPEPQSQPQAQQQAKVSA